MQNRRNLKDCQGYFRVDFGVIPGGFSLKFMRKNDWGHPNILGVSLAPKK
jgi:inner membrane protein involved in colicin E2 resistance